MDIKKNHLINPEMTVLDIISKYRKTEEVFRKYDEKAGECICCRALFDPLKELSKRYGLDMERLIAEIEVVALLGE